MRRRPPPAPTTPTAPPARPLGGADVAVGLGVVVLGLIGFYNSFSTVAGAMEESFPGRAWTVPFAIDVGIAVFTGLDLRMAARGARTTWVRLFPWALNGVTVYLNVAEQHTWSGRVAHGALPILWIAAVEGVVLLVNRRHTATVKPDRLPLALWLLAPARTVVMWRRMRMRGVTSYAAAVEMTDNRRLVRARLAQQYGRRWARHAPAETVELFRMGRLVATDVVVEVPATIPARTDRPLTGDRPVTDRQLTAGGTGTGRKRDQNGTAAGARKPRARRASSPPGHAPAVSAEVLADARALVAEHFDGEVPGRDRLVPLLRSQHGHRLPSAVAAELMRQLKAAPAAVQETAPAAHEPNRDAGDDVARDPAGDLRRDLEVVGS